MNRFKYALTIFVMLAGLVCLGVAQEPEKAEPGKTAAGQAESKEKAESKEGEKKEAREKKLSPEEIEKAEQQEHKDLLWKSINFVLLMGLIIYFLAKPAAQFFTDRTAAIQKGMADAAAARQAAEKQMAEIQQKLARLDDDIAALRADAAKEDEVQAARMREATEAEGAKILAAAEAEMDTMTRSARLELKKYAAQLAVQLAEERIKGRMNAATQEHLLESYVRDLKDGGKN